MDKELSIPKSMVKMLKKFLTKDLALQFTAIRTSSVNKNKHRFKPTQLCSLIEGTLFILLVFKKILFLKQLVFKILLILFIAVIIKSRSVNKALNTDQEALNSALTDVFTNVSKWKLQL